MLKGFLAFSIFCVVLWATAFLSMQNGNPTAINALVGIPFGWLMGSTFFWIFTQK